MHSLISILVSLALVTQLAQALPKLWKPRDSGFNGFDCSASTENYNITAQTGPFDGPARSVAGQKCEAHMAGCSISDGKTYTVSVLILSGFNANLNLGQVAQIGFTTQVAISTTNAESITTTVNCAANCTCGLQVVPSFYHIEGFQITKTGQVGGGPKNACGRGGGAPKYTSYAVNLPVIDPTAAKNNQAVVEYSACVLDGTTCPADPSLPTCPPANLSPNPSSS